MSSFDIEKFPHSTTAKRMIRRISPIYNKAYTAKWLFEVMGQEMDEAWQIMRELREQEFPETVTWAIDFWEQKFSLKYNPNLTLEERRARLKRKMMFHYPLNPARLEKIIFEGFNIITDVNETYAPGVLEINVNSNGQDLSNTLPIYKELYRTKPSHLSILITRHVSSDNIIQFGGAVTLDREIILNPIATAGATQIKDIYVAGAVGENKEIEIKAVATAGADLTGDIKAGGAATAQKEFIITQRGTGGANIDSSIYAGGAVSGLRDVIIRQKPTGGATNKLEAYAVAAFTNDKEIFIKQMPTIGGKSKTNLKCGGTISENREISVDPQPTAGGDAGGNKYAAATTTAEKEIVINKN